MARTLEELDREITTLRAEVDLLKQQDATWTWCALIREFAGCFTNDDGWAAIHAKIEEERRHPDPELTEP